jgi:DNA (cytosine-5)-methyltransferase 1
MSGSKKLKHGSLFSGLGGFDLASEWMGWDNVFHCEINPFGQQVLKYYWPNAIQYDDIKKTDFTIHRGQIDVLTGGFPCQPFSQAGKRKGTEDERHLWPQMLRAIREIKPKWIVGENVYGIVNWDGGMVFHQIKIDLEAQGYTLLPIILPAVSVNAPHRRDRVWFVAYANCDNGAECRNDLRLPPNSIRNYETNPQKWDLREFKFIPYIKAPWNFTDSDCKTTKRLPKSTEQKYSWIGSDGRDELTPNSNGCGRIQDNQELQARESKFSISSGFDQFPTQSPLCSGDDGLPTKLDGLTFPKWRAESIKAYGNAIVPQVALQIFKVIAQM